MPDQLQSPIQCRVRKHKACQQGDQLPQSLDPWEDDGTWDPRTGTIICTPCYIAIGQPRNPRHDPDGLAAERGQRPHHDNEGNETP